MVDTPSTVLEWNKQYALDATLAEDVVWRVDVAPQLGPLPDNVSGIWHYGFTEMFNNVIDHSEAHYVSLSLSKTATATAVYIQDDGVGVFKKIQAALKLEDERHAALELAKGKFTTNPTRHSGEGIFFTSRIFDEFVIMSGEVLFSHDLYGDGDWIAPSSSASRGTLVRMVLRNDTMRTLKKVFDQFASDDDYEFTKTIVPVKLMRYGDDNLVSRSQAKRLLSRLDRFKVVVLDFSDVASVGQAFADEIFRVFQIKHPEIEIVPVNVSSDVKRMITRATSHGSSDA
jgi:hypothetical protein